MHPTIEEQLRAIRRLVEDGNDDALANASRQLRRLEGNVGRREAFLRADNDATAALLAALGVSTGAVTAADAHDRNTGLRALLADLARNGPPDVVAPIAAHLRQRVRTDPTLNRPTLHPPGSPSA